MARHKGRPLKEEHKQSVSDSLTGKPAHPNVVKVTRRRMKDLWAKDPKGMAKKLSGGRDYDDPAYRAKISAIKTKYWEEWRKHRKSVRPKAKR